MLLSSVNRLIYYTGLTAVEDKRFLTVFLNSVSALIQKKLELDYEIKERTEKFDIDNGAKEYFPKAFPITAIAAVHTDYTGLFTGSEVAESNYYIGQNQKSVVLFRGLPGGTEGGLRIRYTGGVAIHPVNSVFTLTDVGDNDFEVEDYVQSDSFAGFGQVIAYDDTDPEDISITIESLYGAFAVGDVLSAVPKEGGEAMTGKAGTISAIVSHSLVEAKPNVAAAIENEIRYLQKNKNRFETQGVTKDGGTNYRPMDGAVYNLQPETLAFLHGEGRVWL